ncbi:MAG: hypothetical protein ACTSO9_06620, partial [Candidatus Helarchaeota archaeon]
MDNKNIQRFIREFNNTYELMRDIYESNSILLQIEFKELLIEKDFIKKVKKKFTELKKNPDYAMTFNDYSQVFTNLLEKLCKEAVMFVKMGGGCEYKRFLKYNIKAKDFDAEIKVIEKGINFLDELTSVLKNGEMGEILFKEYYEKVPRLTRMVYIKLFSCLFPEEILPIFSENVSKTFLSYLNPDYKGEFPETLIKLRKDCKEKFCEHGLLDNPSHIVAFLYLYSPFFKYPKLEKELKKLNFLAYPSGEQNVVGIFLAMISSNYSFPEFCDELKYIKNIIVQTDYPDYIGKIENEEKGINKKVYIEFKYELEKFDSY